MKKYITDWNLGLLYKNEKDPQIEKDLKVIERACADFEKKYKNKDYISSPSVLFAALTAYEVVRELINGRKPWWYFALRTSLNSNDNVADAQSTKYSQRITGAVNKISFFTLAIARIPKARQKEFLKAPVLKPFSYLLLNIFKHAAHDLPEGEEQLVHLLSQTSYSMWKNGQSKVLNQKTVSHNGEDMPLAKAMNTFADLPKKERRELYGKIIETLKSCGDFAESEINAVYTYKKVLDTRRGFKKAYSETVLEYENDEKTVENLVSVVTKHFSISKRFYRLHAKLLKEQKITYADRNTKAGTIEKKFSFDESVRIVREVFANIDQKYADILDRFLARGHIDVYPKKGKSGGAFCWGMGDNPTYVLLNHADEIRSVETLAHEMGHAIHDELSHSQPRWYQGVSTATAEVASTFFEQAVSAELEKYLTGKEKIIFLQNKIMGDISTIFRQIACFNFELDLHTQIREKGMVPKDDIAKLLGKHMKAYLGDAVEVTHDDGYTFVSWSHIRNFFYVYSYAYGQLISRALFEKWKTDPSYAEKVAQFLSAGSSMSPYEIFKKIGIDTSDPSFFLSGLKSIEKDIIRLEKLTENTK